MTSPIWPLSTLKTLLDHPEPSVQKWAVSKLFHLYPVETRSRLVDLLGDGRPAVALEALNQFQRDPIEALAPVLGELYLSDEESISSRAIRILGDLKYRGAVEWMKERIVRQKHLSPDQIVGMIYALGRIHSDEAYSLLKQTETAIRDRDSHHWEIFYASLLQHRRADDVETLFNVIMEEDERGEPYRVALGLILGEIDLRLNPSNVFFLNPSPLQKHWLMRLDELERGQVSGDSAGVLGALRELIPSLTPDAGQEVWESLKRLGENLKGSSPFEESVFLQGLTLLGQGAGSMQKPYALLCIIVSAMVTALEEVAYPAPPPDSSVKEKIVYLLRNRAPKPMDETLTDEILKHGDRAELCSLLLPTLRDDPQSWGALRSVEMLGRLHAEDALEDLVESLEKAKDDLFVEALRTALSRIGVSSVPYVIRFLDSSHPMERSFALTILGRLPTAEGVVALKERSISLHAKDSEAFLQAVYESGSEAFLPFLEKEYRPGEWELGRVYVHLCRVNNLQPDGLDEMERGVEHAEALIEEQRRIMSGDTGRWPSVILLELACRDCTKKYQYEVSEIHLHPHDRDPAEEPDEDWIPYKHGVVICDDIRCKNCGSLNRVRLTSKTLAQITSESVRILALQKGGIRVPSSYPVKHVQLDEREGKPLTLLDAENEHFESLKLSPDNPATHLALGKFYEYVKELSEAKRCYLKAVDLESQALEAMAGLARLAHVEGNLKEANDWIEDCYNTLDKGRIYLAQDAAAFKKTVRQKRREFARELGVKPQDKPVKILFSVDVPEHPKNKPCPCGSGKKYKLCCMKADSPTGD